MRMSRKGNDLVRHYLWMAAQCACLHNPAIRALYRRQRQAGKRGDVALGHCVRKLLHLVYAVWKTDRPFDPKHYAWEPEAPSAQESQAPEAVVESPKAERAAETEVTPTTTPTVAAPTQANKPQPASSPVRAPARSRSGPPRGKSIDYRYLREQLSIAQVLELLRYPHLQQKTGDQVRGPCPLHADKRSRPTFSVNLKRGVFRCFASECAAHGNALDLYVQATGLSLHAAALDLADKLHLQLQRNREEEPVT
jgi:hypothetical protein